MPEAFDLDDDSYDPLGVNPKPAEPAKTPPENPASPTQPPAASGPRPPSRADDDETGSALLGTTGTAPARPPSRPTAQPPRTGSIPPQSGRVGTGSIPTRTPVGSSPEAKTGPATSTRATTVAPAHAKPSDLLRGHPNYKAQESPDNRPVLPFLTRERPITRIDDFVRGLLTLTAIVVVLCFLYCLYGLITGQLSNEMFGPMPKADKDRIIANLDMAHAGMTYSMLLGVLCMVFLFYDEGPAAYLLVGLAVFLQVVMPLAVSQWFGINRTAPSLASVHLTDNLRDVAWIPGLPGIVLLFMELARRFVSGLEEQRIKRRHLTYGQGIVKSEKVRNVFLGNCWSLPFCREKVRAKCPIFLARKGPCWRNKRGCMCDETIVMQATPSDWKQNVSAAREAIEARTQTKAPTRAAPPPVSANQQLSMAFKKERCRQCVIFNVHQEQKYKALVMASMVGLVLVFYNFYGPLLNEVSTGYHVLDVWTQHLSFDAGHGGPSIPHNKADQASEAGSAVNAAAADLSGPVGWVVLIIIAMFVVSKVLQVIEYACFTLKI